MGVFIIPDNTEKIIGNCRKIGGGKTEFLVGRNCHLTVVQNLTGFPDTEINFEISGPGSSVLFVGLVSGRGKDAISIKTLQHHISGGSSSRVIVKSVLEGQASLSFAGIIRVDMHATATDAFQQNNNLLLSDYTHVYSRPVLEILTNDLKCTHSVSSGFIRPEELWYLENRGIDPKKATDMIAEGFLLEALDDIKKTKEIEMIKLGISGLF